MFNPDNKDDLREEAKRARARVDLAEDNPEDAVSLFFENITDLDDKVVALHWPKGSEFDCRPILDELLKRDVMCALPVVQKDQRELLFAPWKEGEPLKESDLGIMEPTSDTYVDPDILIIPFLAFDRHGYRLGYGAGHYDSTISALKEKKEILTIGMGYAQQAVLFNLPREEHDQSLDWIITPQRAVCHLDRT